MLPVAEAGDLRKEGGWHARETGCEEVIVLPLSPGLFELMPAPGEVLYWRGAHFEFMGELLPSLN